MRFGRSVAHEINVAIVIIVMQPVCFYRHDYLCAAPMILKRHGSGRHSLHSLCPWPSALLPDAALLSLRHQVPSSVAESAAWTMGRSRKLKNRRLLLKQIARNAAKYALQGWYTHGRNRADAIIPQMQIDSNLKVVAAIPGWQAEKGTKNGYVMLTTLIHGTLRPMILVLDPVPGTPGRLTYRQMHQQIREALGLESKHSLRLCPFRPWYRYMQTSFPIPEHRALPATDAQCMYLLGTTLLYWSYVHLTDCDSGGPPVTCTSSRRLGVVTATRGG